MAKELKMTTNRRLQDDLAASEARYRAIVKDQTEFICRYAPDLSITFANRAYCRFLHKKHHEVYGQTPDKLGVLEVDVQNILATIASLTPAAPSCISEYGITDGAGEVRWVQWTNRAFFDNQGCLVEVQAVGRDITRQRQLEKDLAHYEQLNLIGQMAAGISHEIRNPMTTVRGFLQLLSKKEECQPFKGYLDLMIEELDRANSILSEFLALARNKKMDKKPHNLNAIIEVIYPLLRADALIAEKSILLELEPIPELILDESEMRQLILNLVRNGLEAMQPNGQIKIRTFADGEEVTLAVEDQGSGISPTILNRLGTPFLTTKDNGTGLGLAICYSIAARHNATIQVTTDEAGTTFFIRFSRKNQSPQT